MNPNSTSGPEIRLGISACLLGESVRYDGELKLDSFILDFLKKKVKWVPICPEVGCGLPVPREEMHLVEKGGIIRLLTRNSGIDHTDRLTTWAESKLNELAFQPLAGFILKTRSPSCGVFDAKINQIDIDSPPTTGSGLFARMLIERFPFLPVEDDERFHDPGLWEIFMERVLCGSR